MIVGYVNEALEPVIERGLKGAAGLTKIAAVVDTGFSGELCRAAHHSDRVEMAFAFVERYELANGEVLVEDVFRGTIEFHAFMTTASRALYRSITKRALCSKSLAD